jgi:5-methylcytosine-specific restriction endonuclease McrA
MTIVLSNGTHYIRITDTGKISKTKNVDEAQAFCSCNQAKKIKSKAPSKCRHFHCFDAETMTFVKVKKERKRFTLDERKYIYDKADGYCQLCGKKLKFEDGTMDHIIPLSMGGLNDMSNLQLACSPCNHFKDSILPEAFIQRITEIFLYQTEKKNGNSLKWKIVHRMLVKMI